MKYQHTNTIPTGLDEIPSITIVTAEMLSTEDTKLVLDLLHLQAERIAELKSQLHMFAPLIKNIEKAKEGLDKKDGIE